MTFLIPTNLLFEDPNISFSLENIVLSPSVSSNPCPSKSLTFEVPPFHAITGVTSLFLSPCLTSHAPNVESARNLASRLRINVPLTLSKSLWKSLLSCLFVGSMESTRVFCAPHSRQGAICIRRRIRSCLRQPASSLELS